MGEVVPLHPPEAAPEDRPVLVLDLGGQYSQLIARRVREARVYSELVGHRISADEVARRNPAALVLSGGPASVYSDGAPEVDPRLFELGVPTLGICYGMQLMARDLGGAVDRTGVSEFGKTELAVRAAFRVAAGGGQVAVLVPTTVLADQHAKTFQKRMTGFPVEVATTTGGGSGPPLPPGEGVTKRAEGERVTGEGG